ncbi:MAG: transposase [Candidatus Marithrix sp.]|nr:transposase [Candidatus Marithrix sp.]
MKWKNHYQPNTIYFFTSRITEKIHILRTDDFKQIVVDSLQKYLDKYTVSLYGYVIMNNHVHILISALIAESVKSCVQQTLRDSSCKISRKLESFLDTQFASQAQSILQTFAKRSNGKARYAVWKEQARGVPINTATVFQTKLDYIHNNPVRAQLVSEPSAYRFSSYLSVYRGESGMLPIETPVL